MGDKRPAAVLPESPDEFVLSRGACAYLRRHWALCQPITGHTHTLSFTHAITHYGQFKDANQPTMHVFGLGEETGVPGGNPRGTGRTCKLHTHGGGGNPTPNPGGVRQTC
ncbi:hypothetical protein QTP70_031056 [Hemibagrus guttatus]|uniref:Uncharacterized protein n=1 Tax=Hemibagrus guttatus TaxID=175788 RepID=A0AAE0PYD4_9TELE|nr:hypothetical protein QTP70_031056 [Hemibagrus guttatus]